jgi:hypothetical protein
VKHHSCCCINNLAVASLHPAAAPAGDASNVTPGQHPVRVLALLRCNLLPAPGPECCCTQPWDCCTPPQALRAAGNSLLRFQRLLLLLQPLNMGEHLQLLVLLL